MLAKLRALLRLRSAVRKIQSELEKGSHRMDKPLLASKTVWGAIFGALAVAAPVILSALGLGNLVEPVRDILAALAVLLGVTGFRMAIANGKTTAK